jgi:virginiamycin B lyase
MKTGNLLIAAGLLLGALSLPASACRPFGSYEFAEDKDGGIWFTEGDNNAISRLAPDGTVVSHPLPTANAEPSSVALAPDGGVWFAEMEGKKIGRLDRDGRIVEFAVPSGSPLRVVVDAAGEAWFAAMADHGHGGGHAHHGNPSGVGRIDREGRVHFHPVPEGWPTSIALDAKGQVWVTLLVPGDSDNKAKGRIARLGRDGQWTIVAARDGYSCPRNLVPDAKGGLFFSDGCRETAGHRDARGKLSEWRLPQDTRIQDLALGHDGRLWFTDRKHVGHIVKGKVTYIDRADNGDATMAILATRQGDVLFSEFYNYNINRLTRGGQFVEHLVSVDERKGMREVKEGEVCYVQFAARIAAKAEMDKKRAEEVRNGRFKPDGQGTEKLAEQKCLACHDARRLLLSRRSDWSPSIGRMHAYRETRQVEPLTAEENTRLTRYFNENYGLR